MFRSLPLCLVCLICVALVGCKNKVSPSGKVTRDGKDFKLSDKGMFIISFFAEADKEMKNPLQAETKPDGTFTLIGKDRKGVPPGKYRASVQAFDPYGGPDKKDVLDGKFSGAWDKLVAVDVGSGEVEIKLPK